MRLPKRTLLALSAFTACFAAVAGGAAATPLVLMTTGDVPATGLAVFQQNPDGSLSAAPGSPHETGDSPHGVAVTPDGRFAFVANLGDDSVSSFSIAPDGALTPVGTVPTGANQPTDVAVTPDGRFVLITNRDATDAAPRISVLSVGAGGALTPVGGSPFNLGVFDPRSVVVSPNGDFAYVSARRGPSGPPASNADRALAVASIGQNGTLTPIGGSPFYGALLTNAFELSISPDGERLFEAGVGNDTVEVFDLNQNTGVPAPVAGSPFTIGTSPLQLVSDPTGARLLLGNAGIPESVQAVDVNPATGALTAAPGGILPLESDPHGIAITPAGDRAYATVTTDPSSAVGIAIGDDGALTALPGSPIALPDKFPNFFSAAIVPAQTPEPEISGGPFRAGKAATLDASGTQVRGGSATRYDWDFGDGTTLADGGATPTHTYPKAGSYTATVTVTNDCNPQAPFVDGVVSVGNEIYCAGDRTGTTTREIEVTDRVEGSVTAKRKQKQRRKVRVKVKVKAGEALTVRLSGKIRKAGKAKLKPKKVKVGAGKTRKLKLKVKRGGGKVLRKLDNGRKGKATIKAKLTDELGTVKVEKLKVKLRAAGGR